MSADNNVRGIKTDANIVSMPGYGRRWIRLTDFSREATASSGQILLRCGSRSHIVNNARIDAYHRHPAAPAQMLCDGPCERPFGQIYGYKAGTEDTAQARASYKVAAVQTPQDAPKQKMLHFCWDCASDAQAMRDSCDDNFLPIIAQDGNDVFAYIANAVHEDSIADSHNDTRVDFRLHHAGYVKPDYRNVIGGKMATYQFLKTGAEAKFAQIDAKLAEKQPAQEVASEPEKKPRKPRKPKVAQNATA